MIKQRLAKRHDRADRCGKPQLSCRWLAVALGVVAVPLLDIGNQLLKFQAGMTIPNFAFNGLSWVVFAVVAGWYLVDYSGELPLRIFTLLTLAKWAVYILAYRDLSLRKDMFVTALLFLVMFQYKPLRVYFSGLLVTYKYLILFLVCLSFLPFLDQYRMIGAGSKTGDGMVRVSGLWENSKMVGMYFIALMTLLPRKRIFLISFLYLLVIYCGSRSGILAATVYFGYVLYWQYDRLGNRDEAPAVVAVGFALAFCALIALLSGKLATAAKVADSNLRPLLQENIRSDGYGSGRVGLNRIALEAIADFSLPQLLLGRSYTSLGDVYEEKIGARTWPHNDFVMAAYCHGLVGLVFYVYYLFVYPWKRIQGRDWKRLMAVQGTIFMLAATSGFYPYRASFLLLLSCGRLAEDGARAA